MALTDPTNILLVDNEPSRLISLLSVPESLQCNVVRAGTVTDALCKSLQYDVALMIVDVDTDNWEGFKIADRVAEKMKTFPCTLFLVNNHSEIASRLQHSNIRTYDCLEKPVTPDELTKQVEFHVGQYRRRQSVEVQQVKDEKYKDDLAGGLAHQFNNMLNIIVGNVELLRMENPYNPGVERCGNAILKSVNHMSKLTEKLLAYAKEGNYFPECFEFDRAIQDAVAEIVSPESGIAVTPECNCGSELVNADSTQLKMMVSALVKNAYEAISDRGIITLKTFSTVYSEESGMAENTTGRNYVCLEVSDNGRGMSESEMDRMFEPFFSTKFKGRGMDLAAVQGIVSIHSGKIDVRSKEGAGTTVTVSIPVAQAKEFRPERQRIKGFVLIMDKNIHHYEQVVVMLQSMGYHPLPVETETDLLGIVQRSSERIDFILMDSDHAGMDSVSVCNRLTDIRKDLKIVVSMSKADKSCTSQSGCRSIMTLEKPITCSGLAELIPRINERRLFERHIVKDCNCQFHEKGNQSPVTMIDISKGGLSFSRQSAATPYEGWSGKATITAGGLFRIPEIPVRVVSSGNSDSLAPEGSQKDRVTLEFGALTAKQAEQMEYLIKHYSINT